MRLTGSMLAFSGKFMDLATTIIGVSLGFAEMNPLSLRPVIIIFSLVAYPILLDLLYMASDQWVGGRFKRILLLPGLVAWVPVFWNLWVMIRW